MRSEAFGLSGKVKSPFDLPVKGYLVSEIRDSEAGRLCHSVTFLQEQTPAF